MFTFRPSRLEQRISDSLLGLSQETVILVKMDSVIKEEEIIVGGRPTSPCISEPKKEAEEQGVYAQLAR